MDRLYSSMNKLIEMINYSSDSYWGDPEKFKFNAKIDTYNNTTEISQGENRVVKTNFGLTIQGYLVPDSLNKKLASENMLKTYSKSIVSFGSEIISTPDTRVAKTREQVRNLPLAQNIEPIGESLSVNSGIGFQVIGQTNKIG